MEEPPQLTNTRSTCRLVYVTRRGAMLALLSRSVSPPFRAASAHRPEQSLNRPLSTCPPSPSTGAGRSSRRARATPGPRTIAANSTLPSGHAAVPGACFAKGFGRLAEDALDVPARVPGDRRASRPSAYPNRLTCGIDWMHCRFLENEARVVSDPDVKGDDAAAAGGHVVATCRDPDNATARHALKAAYPNRLTVPLTARRRRAPLPSRATRRRALGAAPRTREEVVVVQTAAVLHVKREMTPETSIARVDA